MSIKNEYKEMIESYASEIVEGALEKQASYEEDLDPEIQDLLMKTAALYDDAEQRMDAALEVLAEADEILVEANEIGLDKLAAEDDGSLEIVAEYETRYNTAFEVLAEAEEDADNCETIFKYAGVIEDEDDEEYEDDDEYEDDEEYEDDDEE